MILWIIFATLTLVVLDRLLSPLLRQPAEAPQRMDYDLIVYRDQLAEIDKDIERGLLTAEQATGARAEIHRRMLAAETVEIVASPKNDGTSRSRFIPVIVILIGLPLGAGFMYNYLGSPELPGRPYAERKNDLDFLMAAEAERLAPELRKNPDAEGYRHLATIDTFLHRHDEAAEAYRQIIAINGGSAEIWSDLGEALALSQDGLVMPEARIAFSKALALDPHEPRARFYLGLSEAQNNELRRAVAIWRDLERDSPPDAPWVSMLKEQIARTSKKGGFDPASVTPQAATGQ